MKIFFIYTLLITFYIDQVLGAAGISHIMRGLSLKNFNIYLLFIVWLISIMKRDRKSIFIPNSTNKYIFIMCIIVLMSIFVKILHSEIKINIKYEFILFKGWFDPVFIFLILYNIVANRDTCNRVLFGLSLLNFALILTQLSATYGYSEYRAETIIQNSRAGGFGAPGEFAISLVLFLPFFLSQVILANKNRLLKIYFIFLVVLNFVGLVNAGSRNGAVSLFICITVYAVLLIRNRILGFIPITLMFIGVIIAGICAFYVSPSNVKIVVSERFDPNSAKDLNKYTSGRTENWKDGLKLFFDSPIFGHGQNSYRQLKEVRKYINTKAAHNEYLKHLVEYGIIGFIFYCLIYLSILINIKESIKHSISLRERLLYISYIAGFMGYTVGLFATNGGPSLYLFWIYTAIVYKYGYFNKERKEIYKEEKICKKENIKTANCFY